jgi:KipI family sensor histidine kinase inhibitor
MNFTFFFLSERVLEVRTGTVQHQSYYIQLAIYLEKKLQHIDEVINTEDSVAIFASRHQMIDHEKVESLCQGFNFQETEMDDTRILEIPCYYTKENTDLSELADKLNMTETEIVKMHSEAIYQVAMYGFMPGFVYLKGLNKRLQIERKASPSLRIVPGSVAIAADYTGVYPAQSSGGWYVLGFTSMRLFDAEVEDPIHVKPGDRVRFTSIEKETYERG